MAYRDPIGSKGTNIYETGQTYPWGAVGFRVWGTLPHFLKCTVASDPAAIASKGQREFILASFSAEVNSKGEDPFFWVGP